MSDFEVLSSEEYRAMKEEINRLKDMINMDFSHSLPEHINEKYKYQLITDVIVRLDKEVDSLKQFAKNDADVIESLTDQLNDAKIEIDRLKTEALDNEISALKDQLKAKNKLINHCVRHCDENRGDDDIKMIISINEKFDELKERLAKTEDQLRWRKYPEEKPEKEGMYLCTIKDDAECIIYYRTVWFRNDVTGFKRYDEIITHWLPIPEIKGE